MNRPEISVIIPAYNAMDYLPDTLASALAQEGVEIEVLVMDDGSTDGTAQWLAAKASADPRIRVFAGSGLGPARARNMLIGKANSDLIAFLDADDLWMPGKLEPELAFHRNNPDVAFTFTDYRHARPDGSLGSTCYDYWKPRFLNRAGTGFQRLPDPLANLLEANVAGTSAVVAKRKSLQLANGFREDLPSAEDWDLWLRLAETQPVAASAEVTMLYLIRPGSETSKRGKRFEAMAQILARYADPSIPVAARLAARARLLEARYEMRRSEGDLAGAFLSASHAFLVRPSAKLAREALSCLKRLPSGLLEGKAR